MVGPMKLSCDNHEGGGAVKFQEWDGKKWIVITAFGRFSER